MTKIWDPEAGEFVDPNSDGPHADGHKNDTFVPSLGTTPLFPNVDTPQDESGTTAPTPNVSSTVPTPDINS